MSSISGINLSDTCAKCGGNRWEYVEKSPEGFIQELRCLEYDCGYQDLTYPEGRFTSYKTPEEVEEFIEDYCLKEEPELQD